MLFNVLRVVYADCALSVSGLPCDVRWKPGVHSLLRHNPVFHLTSDQLVRLHSTNNVLV